MWPALPSAASSAALRPGRTDGAGTLWEEASLGRGAVDAKSSAGRASERALQALAHEAATAGAGGGGRRRAAAAAAGDGAAAVAAAPATAGAGPGAARAGSLADAHLARDDLDAVVQDVVVAAAHALHGGQLWRRVV